MTHPNALARALSYFHSASRGNDPARSRGTAWELALVIAMLVLFSALTIWLAGKAFRMGMLQYPPSNSASFSRKEARQNKT